MALTSYVFDEEWFVDAPPEQVWQHITDIPNYPAWWPQFVWVKRLNDLADVGAKVKVRVKSALPYYMHFSLEATRREPVRVAEVRASGDLNGWMRWDLTPEGTGTRLRFREEVRTGKQLLNVLAPLFKPAFAWNHRIMMRHGEAGLRRIAAQQSKVQSLESRVEEAPARAEV